MKNNLKIFILSVFILALSESALAQCAVCTKTALQMGEKPAQGLNSAILYLMAAPFAIIGFIGFRWWKSNKLRENEENSVS